jgi:16S rRNA (adenine1518-N6/adenine1519-N6)-dimethyltransferase
MVHPKKHLGQHFLTDPSLAARIVEALSPDVKELLEIGPGKGILTRIILHRDLDHFHAIEIDGEAVRFLDENLPEIRGRIIHGDFLKSDLDQYFRANFSIIGNFPYNISSQILFRIIDLRHRVDEVVGMFQKEVAERIASPPGSKKYGIISVITQAYYTIEYLFTVKEGAFFPPPNVRSAVIKLKRNSTVQLDCNERIFFNLVKTAFNQRRKTLRNALKSFHFKGVVQEGLLQQRAEQLGVEEFVQLARAVEG